LFLSGCIKAQTFAYEESHKLDIYFWALLWSFC